MLQESQEEFSPVNGSESPHNLAEKKRSCRRARLGDSNVEEAAEVTVEATAAELERLAAEDEERLGDAAVAEVEDAIQKASDEEEEEEGEDSDAAAMAALRMGEEEGEEEMA